ncbi:MAG: radical SAM protein [Candidatus Nanoarchaeia archaeon]|nr:radical SAM protein [Candidatus Nanoarchaeia archaeon]
MLVNLIRPPDPTSLDDMLDEPLGLLYLAASLMEKGHEAKITNLACRTRSDWESDIPEADLYGIQLYTPTANNGVDIARFVKEKFGKPIVGGGAHPTAIIASSEETELRNLLSVFDHLVAGEGENVLPQIADAYRNGETPPQIMTSEQIADLDSIPLPARNLVDMMSFNRKVDGERSFGIVGSRGCSYKCSFCDHSLFGEKVRFRSIDEIVGEIKGIISGYGVRHLEFFDDMFTVSRKRLREFRDKTKGLHLSYRCNGRSDILSKDTYDLVAESGGKVICFGIESGSQRMLDLMNKRTTVEDNFKAIKIAQSAGLIAMGYFLIGFPGETKETIQETKRFIEESGIDQAQAYTFIPLPGTEIYRHPEKFGIIRMHKDYSDYFQVTGADGRGGKVVDTEYLTAAELQEEVMGVRKFLREHTWRGKVQDYYKKVGIATQE